MLKFINLSVRNRNDKFDLQHDCYALTTTGADIDNRSTVFTSREFSTKGSRPLFNEPHTLAGAIAFNLNDEDTVRFRPITRYIHPTDFHGTSPCDTSRLVSIKSIEKLPCCLQRQSRWNIFSIYAHNPFRHSRDNAYAMRHIRFRRVKCSPPNEGAILHRRQSTLSETLARFAAPNFAFIIFIFFFSLRHLYFVRNIRMDIRATNEIT